MKVREMLSEESLRDYSKRLVKTLNIKRLGAGAFSHVFQHPEFSNVVVKVYTNKDRTYARYAQWCLRNQGNPYVPQIISITPFESVSGDAYNIVFMEKMTPLSDREFYSWVKSVAGPQAAKDIKNDEWRNAFNSFREAMVVSKDENLKKVMRHIFSYGSQKFDLHAGNLMKRGSQVVFTDPVFVGGAHDRVDDHDDD